MSGVMSRRIAAALAAVAALVATGGWTASQAQSGADEAGYQTFDAGDGNTVMAPADHAAYFRGARSGRASQITNDVTAKLAKFGKATDVDLSKVLPPSLLSEVIPAKTATSAMPSAPGGSRTDALQNPAATGPSATIDKYIFERLAQEQVTAAPPSNDFEFIRRVTLDLTGRIPTANEVVAFVTDPSPNKRAALVDQLLASPEWVDKWTVWFADLYENNSRNVLNANRFIQGVLSFNGFIRESLASGKPYDQMAREMIAAQGANSYEQGELNFLVGGVMGGGPVQDIFDQQIAVTAEKFLGISHMDCLLCHNGRGHLDAQSLWGYFSTRKQAWGMASFLSHTATVRVPVNSGMMNPYYWTLQNDVQLNRRQDYTVDYRLNTETGNRPARGPLDSAERVAPQYIFTLEGQSPEPLPGEDYRTALARNLTADPQFARAIVNYLWEYFFEIGLVTPSNQFDPMRVDPDNPPELCPLPTNPCDLQPSHPRLLQQLSQDFIDSGYDLKALMRQIAHSQAYQLSSRYDGEWDPAWERLFARKLVRRLWSEEIHDALVKSSGVAATYSNRNWGPVNWAMQLPEPNNTPNFQVSIFLDAFLRGNRDDEERSSDTSVTQALAMMNDPFVIFRVISDRPNTLIENVLPLPDDQAVYGLYLTVLSRLPSQGELELALSNIRSGNREGELRVLLWALYNKVDFLFTY